MADTLRKYIIRANRSTKKSTVLVPSTILPYDPIELYHRFLVVAPDYKGQLSCLSGAKGIRVTATIGVDFGQMILPFLELSVTTSGEATVLKEVLILVQRAVPRRLLNAENTNVIWHTDKPVNLMYATGKTVEISAALSTGAGVGLANMPLGKLTSNIGFLGSGVDFTLSGKAYYVEGIILNQYSNGMEKTLQKDFDNLLGKESLKDVLEEGATFFLALRDKTFPILNFQPVQSIGSSEVVKEHLLNKIKNALNFRLPGRKRRVNRDRAMDFLNDFERALETIKNAASTTVDINTLINAVIELKGKLFISDNIPEFNKESLKGIPTLADAPSPKLAFLEVAILSPEINAKATARIGSSSVSIGSNEGAVGTDEPSAGTRISANYSFKKVSSRYQTFNISPHEKRPLLLTQDTETAYHRFEVGKTIDASLTAIVGHQLQVETSDTLKVFINKMTYQSVIAYWKYPEPENVSDNTRIELLPGSGIAIGSSLGIDFLFDLAKNIQAESPLSKNAEDKLNGLAKMLKLKPDLLRSFLFQLFTPDDLKFDTQPYTELSNVAAILLEVSFAFIPGQSIQVNLNRKTQDSKLVDLIDLADGTLPWSGLFKPVEDDIDEEYYNEHQIRPESIRVRIRIADQQSNETSVFRLGISFGGSFGIGIDKVTRFGNEGIFDFNQYFFEAITEGEEPQSSETFFINHSQRLEQAVPAVFLAPYGLE